MSDVAQRKRAETARKKQQLTDELSWWSSLAVPGKKLAKHNSQLIRLQRVVTAALDTIGTESCSDWRTAEDHLLSVHQVWDFFRSMLTLRLVDHFTEHLVVADELAWACYQPALTKALAAGGVDPANIREPPLTFYDVVGSPFAVARGDAFDRHVAPRRLRSGAPRELAKHLPVPVIGIPWSQIGNFSELVIVAHETGHHVEDDFGLSGRIDELATDALQKGGVERIRRDRWTGWLGEAFADVYATVALGPAFAGALVDFLVALETVAPSTDAELDVAYPPPSTRVSLVCAALRFQKHDETAAELSTTWAEAVPSQSTQFDEDAPIVAAALIGGSYPTFADAALHDVIAFDAEAQKRAKKNSRRLLLGDLPESRDVRVLIAAAAIAMRDDGDAFAALACGQRTRAAVLATVDSQTRGPARQTRGSEPVHTSAATDKARADVDARTGQGLLAWFEPSGLGSSSEQLH